ncbi:MAG TPA: hypothetical protein VJ789_05655 [Burkholderiales bacterium]|nr:hypothetical protein [Burkholderiales bacterium]
MMQQFRASSTLFGGNAPFVEQLYEQWLENPQGVPAQWRDYFERLQGRGWKNGMAATFTTIPPSRKRG